MLEDRRRLGGRQVGLEEDGPEFGPLAVDLADRRFENPVAAVEIDQDQAGKAGIAQRGRDVADDRRERFGPEVDRASGLAVLDRTGDGQRRKQIGVEAPSDRLGHGPGQQEIGSNRQMASMLFDRPDGQDRHRAGAAGNVDGSLMGREHAGSLRPKRKVDQQTLNPPFVTK